MKPYKVVVWGPSGIGNACIRELLRLPDFDLVGVLGYSPEKEGKDAAELVGLEPCGIRVTTDKAAVLALDADCVLYTAAVPVDFEAMNADLVSILESGKNLVSATSLHYAPFHGQAYVDRIEAACRARGVSAHGTGIDPGFMLERMAMTATAMCTSVDHVMLREGVDVANVPRDTLLKYGFGQNPQEIVDGPLRELFSRWMFVETISFMVRALYGRDPDRITHEPLYETAAEPIALEGWVIEPGSVSFIRHLFTGYLDDAARVSIELIWYLRADQVSFEPEENTDKWLVEITGRPTSVKLTVAATTSHGPEPVPDVARKTPPSYYATAAILIQAIPVTCAAPPGLVYATAFTNCTADYATLATRKSLIN